jgi:ketosteroid isomerase-like protein
MPGASDAEADVSAVTQANDAFYAAFEVADLDAMSDLWEHSDRVTCVHPGWAELRGWAAVAASWAAMFQGPERLQFILTNCHVVVAGDTAWVTVDENIIGPDSATVASINVFVRDGDEWRMVAHHGSGVAMRAGRREV